MPQEAKGEKKKKNQEVTLAKLYTCKFDYHVFFLFLIKSEELQMGIG